LRDFDKSARKAETSTRVEVPPKVVNKISGETRATRRHSTLLTSADLIQESGKEKNNRSSARYDMLQGNQLFNVLQQMGQQHGWDK